MVSYTMNYDTASRDLMITLKLYWTEQIPITVLVVK